MNMKVMYSIVNSTMYNGDGVRKYSHHQQQNTNNISTTPKHSKVGVGVISVFKATPRDENVVVWVMKAGFDFTTATTSSKSCEHQLHWNNNNTTIYATPKGSNVEDAQKSYNIFLQGVCYILNTGMT